MLSFHCAITAEVYVASSIRADETKEAANCEEDDKAATSDRVPVVMCSTGVCKGDLEDLRRNCCGRASNENSGIKYTH